MNLYPAIDIYQGNAVRLRQGRREEATVYGSPREMARRWTRSGARWLHVVDLDGAFEGRPRNTVAIEEKSCPGRRRRRDANVAPQLVGSQTRMGESPVQALASSTYLVFPRFAPPIGTWNCHDRWRQAFSTSSPPLPPRPATDNFASILNDGRSEIRATKTLDHRHRPASLPPGCNTLLDF